MKRGVKTIALLSLVASASVLTTASAADASRSDLAQADRFLAELPSACSGSYKYVGSDGTVNIRVKCDGNGKKMNGLVTIKNGIVTNVQ
ncbi:MAG: hypothetical protein NW204_06790 [Xanthomonadaceae bacterium]|nr:hypothetical protein [Xanthomonadaceae bacterium]